MKHISLVLLAAFSILLVHDLVPHHHHLDALAHTASLDCPEGHHDHSTDGQEHDKDGRHCHAFNDISFVKYVSSGIPRPVILVFDHLGPVPGNDTWPETIRINRHILSLKIPIQDPRTKGLHLMRAPPLL